MNGLVTCVDLNVLQLGSYDVLIGMDWLEAHIVNLYCYNNTFDFIYEEQNLRVVKFERSFMLGIFQQCS